MEALPPMETLNLHDGEAPRKLAISGWGTSDETLRLHFPQFGGMEHTETMQDQYSRGFGFVTYSEASAAHRSLLTDHSIDGRRCEAKMALHKGGPCPPRTSRIFVARVPPSVSEGQFRAYFEAFGKLQDAYMPRDHSKQGYRGIGFVTYACPEAVEKVMAVKHWMHGHELAIDCATPKSDDHSASACKPSLMPFQQPIMSQRRSFDNGAGIIGPGLTSVLQLNSGLGTIGEGQVSQYPPLSAMEMSSLSEDCNLGAHHMLLSDRDLSAYQSPSISHQDLATHLEMSSFQPAPMVPGSGRWTAQMAAQDAHSEQGASGNNGLTPSESALRARQALGLSLGDMGLHSRSAAAAAVAASAALQTLANAQSAAAHNAAVQQMMASERQQQADESLAYGVVNSLCSLQLAGAGFGMNAFHSMSDDGHAGGFRFPSLPPAHNLDRSHSAVHQLMAAQLAASQRRSIDNSGINMARRSIGENPAIATARAGARIFIGKLTRDTTESDVKDYFSRFGYVMDVYLPKSRDNKAEHRGFGFVTFETQASIQRVVSNGAHRLRGSTIAIDIAMPKEEESDGADGSGGRNSFDGNQPYCSHLSNAFANSNLAGLGGQLPMLIAQHN